MRYVAVLFLLVLIVPDSYAQDPSSSCGSARFAATTPLERASWVVGSSLVFALGDYVGFNLLKKANYNGDFHPPIAFRISGGLVQALISFILYKECGLNSAIAFNLIWWTWGDDFAYYGWGQLLSWFPWESRAQSGLRFASYNSAGWTPVGLLRQQGTWIAKSTLVAQSIIGFSVSMAILW